VNLARLHVKEGSIPQALQRYHTARQTSRGYLAELLPAFQSQDQLFFLDAYQSWRLAESLSFAASHLDTEDVLPKSFEWLANGKGMAHEALTAQARLLRKAETSADRQMLEELLAVRRQLAQASLLAVPREHAARHQETVARLSKRDAAGDPTGV
jgi:hypothetical protein